MNFISYTIIVLYPKIGLNLIEKYLLFLRWSSNLCWLFWEYLLTKLGPTYRSSHEDVDPDLFAVMEILLAVVEIRRNATAVVKSTHILNHMLNRSSLLRSCIPPFLF